MDMPQNRWVIFNHDGDPIVCGKTRKEATGRLVMAMNGGAFNWLYYKRIGYTRRKVVIT